MFFKGNKEIQKEKALKEYKELRQEEKELNDILCKEFENKSYEELSIYMKTPQYLKMKERLDCINGRIMELRYRILKEIY